MSDLIDRLRANLRVAGVPATDEDLEGIVARGFLARAPDFQRLAAAAAGDHLPDYLDHAALPAPPAAAPPAGLPEPTDADSLLATAARLRAGAVSPVELAEAALAAAGERGQALNAFQLVLAEQAIAAARRAEREIDAGLYRGPLHGVPVAVKDLLDLDGTPTTAGSKIRAGAMATGDATAVARLRDAGAVIVGKTRMSEFAYSPGSNNAHYGPTANPYDQSRDSGGSSSGSGAAVAAEIVFGALGTDTGGSIRIPAALCGIVGLKPTHGRTSLAGGATLSWSLDHLGPLTRSVADAAAMLEALAGPDPRDGRTMRLAPGFVAGGLEDGAQGLRVGVLRDDGTGGPLATADQMGAMRRAAAALEAAGAELVELDIPAIDELRVVGAAILAMEAAGLHLPNLRERLDDYGAFPRQRLLAAFYYGPGEFVLAQQARAGLRRRCGALFDQVDLLLTPCVPDTAPELGVPAPTFFTLPFNTLGWPAISLPAGLSAAGLPLAVQLAALPWDEPTLLRASYTLEQALGRLQAPR
jgi:aspartyl-tRNA(Asn)/glutamyl-tRNA(Gln) amidotransferase subunit A